MVLFRCARGGQNTGINSRFAICCERAEDGEAATTAAVTTQACEDGDTLLWCYFDVHVVARTPEQKALLQCVVRELKMARPLPLLQSQLRPVKMGTLACGAISMCTCGCIWMCTWWPETLETMALLPNVVREKDGEGEGTGKAAVSPSGSTAPSLAVAKLSGLYLQ